MPHSFRLVAELNVGIGRVLELLEQQVGPVQPLTV
jgi:hypothetical protein